MLFSSQVRLYARSSSSEAPAVSDRAGNDCLMCDCDLVCFSRCGLIGIVFCCSLCVRSFVLWFVRSLLLFVVSGMIPCCIRDWCLFVCYLCFLLVCFDYLFVHCLLFVPIFLSIWLSIWFVIVLLFCFVSIYLICLFVRVNLPLYLSIYLIDLLISFLISQLVPARRSVSSPFLYGDVFPWRWWWVPIQFAVQYGRRSHVSWLVGLSVWCVVVCVC